MVYKTGPEARNWRHGYADTPIYKIWQSMKERTGNPNNPGFVNYGSRGIVMCERWLSFENFRADMGERPGPEYSVERKNNDGNYEPGNCVWATKIVQNNNSRNCHWITHDGITDTVVGWAKRLGCRTGVIRTRLCNGWTEAEALAPPFNKGRPHRRTTRYEWNGESLTVPEWSKRMGIPRNVIGYRLGAGWTIERALTEPRRAIASWTPKAL